MYIKRELDPFKIIEKKSYFLFGARSTGKSELIKRLMPKDCVYINLLSTNVFLRLNHEPSLLEDMVKKSKYVVIDEIQKLPILLDEVHRIIEEKKTHFLLTGSSARRLKREFANLLGGRAHQISLFPFTFQELKEFDLNRYLLWGGLPRVYLSEDPGLELDAYLQLYLEQEIQIESNIRNLPPFSRFLKVAALSNAQLINYAAISSDCGVSESTVKEYYQILIDTLIGYRLEPWLESKKRKSISTAKFYFFDVGVRNSICGINHLSRESKEYGELFEHFIINEIKSYLTYRQKRMKMYFWRNTSKHEVDLILDSQIAIEIKSTQQIKDSHLRNLKALQEENIIKKYYVISNDPLERETHKIQLWNWKNFLKKMWEEDFF